MAAESVGRVLKRRSLGVLLIVLILALLSLSVAFYEKVFTSTTDVTLQTDSIGNQLQAQSDVKLRGIIVGEVTSVSSRGASLSATRRSVTWSGSSSPGLGRIRR